MTLWLPGRQQIMPWEWKSGTVLFSKQVQWSYFACVHAQSCPSYFRGKKGLILGLKLAKGSKLRTAESNRQWKWKPGNRGYSKTFQRQQGLHSYAPLCTLLSHNFDFKVMALAVSLTLSHVLMSLKLVFPSLSVSLCQILRMEKCDWPRLCQMSFILQSAVIGDSVGVEGWEQILLEKAVAAVAAIFDMRGKNGAL